MGAVVSKLDKEKPRKQWVKLNLLIYWISDSIKFWQWLLSYSSVPVLPDGWWDSSGQLTICQLGCWPSPLPMVCHEPQHWHRVSFWGRDDGSEILQVFFWVRRFPCKTYSWDILGVWVLDGSKGVASYWHWGVFQEHWNAAVTAPNAFLFFSDCCWYVRMIRHSCVFLNLIFFGCNWRLCIDFCLVAS